MEAGHKVVVLCPTHDKEIGLRKGSPDIYLIRRSLDHEFRSLLPDAIADYEQHFYIDSPEYLLLHRNIAPDILLGRLVVRLHTHLRLALILNGFHSIHVIFCTIIRRLFKGNFRTAISKIPGYFYNSSDDGEYHAALHADLLGSPSKSLLGKSNNMVWRPIAQKAKGPSQSTCA